MDESESRTLAGLAFIAAGTIVILGFVAAASQYPGYSAITQTISALGAEAAPQGSRALFNGVMVLGGVLVLAAAIGLYRADGDPVISGLVGLTATVGLMGVGLFPSETGLPHTIAAAVSFGGVGILALLVAAKTRGWFGLVSAVMGTLELFAFVAFATLRGGTPLGVGGLERVVAYLGLIWVVAFGVVMLERDSSL